MSECVEGSRIGREGTHRGQEVLQHRVVGVAVISLDERLHAGQGLLAPHLVQEHPEDPAPLVVSHRRIARSFAGDLDQGPLGVGLTVLAVVGLESLAEIDPGVEPLDLLDEQDRREVGGALREDVAAGPLAGRQDIAPPLVGGLVAVISKAAWISGLLSVKKPTPSENVILVGKPLGVGGEVGKLAQLQLAPGIGEEPLRVIASGGVEALAHLGDVVGMGGVIVDGRSLAALDLPPARDHVEEAHRVVALPDDASGGPR